MIFSLYGTELSYESLTLIRLVVSQRASLELIIQITFQLRMIPSVTPHTTQYHRTPLTDRSPHNSPFALTIIGDASMIVSHRVVGRERLLIIAEILLLGYLQLSVQLRLLRL